MRRPLLVVGLLIGCAGEAAIPPKAADQDSAGRARLAARPPPGVLWRHEVNAAVDAGLGRTLHYLFQRMTVEPLLDGGQFVGWQVVRLDQPEFWESIDLRLGDVVTAINDRPIERETEAYEAFVALKRAEQLRITLLRGGEQLELIFKIADRGGRAAKPKPGGGTNAKPRPRQDASAKARPSRNTRVQ